MSVISAKDSYLLVFMPLYNPFEYGLTCFQPIVYGKNDEMPFLWWAYIQSEFCLAERFSPLLALTEQASMLQATMLLRACAQELKAASHQQPAGNWDPQINNQSYKWAWKQILPQPSLKMRPQPWLISWWQPMNNSWAEFLAKLCPDSWPTETVK